MTLHRILIANRGEIAVRIIRAIRDAGLHSIAIYADEDFDAPYVGLADEAYALGQSESPVYLNIEKIVELARRHSADAIHPGYGFLSENPDFARAVMAADITWIGPNPETMELLGNKGRSRSLAAEVGAPLVPGLGEPIQHLNQINDFISEYGLPVILKAVHGGGGRGLRVIRHHTEIAEAFDFVKRESTAAFGKAECIVERFIERPRHVEVQILGDKLGRIVVLGTRDCSLQRRHQKLIEEAPAPWLDDDVLEQIFDASIKIARAVGYVGAGTVEFLLGADNSLSFLEVNTRLQVEHPITEMVTGIDIVREQIRIAEGKPLELPDAFVPFGHAIEFRINAEEPALGFVPSPGKIEKFDIPSGPGVRVDSGVVAGSSVPAAFDSLLAKLVVWGADRAEAITRARRAISEFKIEGVSTSLPFHQLVLDEAAFSGGAEEFSLHTRWVEEEFEGNLSVTKPSRVQHAVKLTRFPIEIDGKVREVGIPHTLLSQLDAFQRMNVQSAVDDERTGLDTQPNVVIAPHSGVLTAWKVDDGEMVEENEPLAIVEVMKMEMLILAPRRGTLRHIVREGTDLVEGTNIGTIESSV